MVSQWNIKLISKITCLNTAFTKWNRQWRQGIPGKTLRNWFFMLLSKSLEVDPENPLDPQELENLDWDWESWQASPHSEGRIDSPEHFWSFYDNLSQVNEDVLYANGIEMSFTEVKGINFWSVSQSDKPIIDFFFNILQASQDGIYQTWNQD